MELEGLKRSIEERLLHLPGDLVINDVDGIRKYVLRAYLNRLDVLHIDVGSGNSSLTSKEIILRVVFELITKGIYILYNEEYLCNRFTYELIRINNLSDQEQIPAELVKSTIKAKQILSKHNKEELKEYCHKYSLENIFRKLAGERDFGDSFKKWYKYIYRLYSPVVHSDFTQVIMDFPPEKDEYMLLKLVEILMLMLFEEMIDFYKWNDLEFDLSKLVKHNFDSVEKHNKEIF